MKSYSDFKEWYGRHRLKFVLGWCFILVFLSGYGIGRHYGADSKINGQVQGNYTTKTPVKQTLETTGEGEMKAEEKPAVETAQSKITGPCTIKGNIGAGNKKIYHMQGGAFYDRTQEEMCFNTEAEAKAAGFVKSSR